MANMTGKSFQRKDYWRAACYGNGHVRFGEGLLEKYSKGQLAGSLLYMVFIFERPGDAKRTYEVLGKRLNKFGLELHREKSSLIASGRIAALRAAQAGKRISTYTFLGFTCYWGKAQKGFWRLKYTSRRDRFTATLKEVRKFLWTNLNAKDTDALLESLIRKVNGWVKYHAISDNGRRVYSFLMQVRRIVFKWINRRGGKRPINWEKLNIRLDRAGFPKTIKTISMFG